MVTCIQVEYEMNQLIRAQWQADISGAALLVHISYLLHYIPVLCAVAMRFSEIEREVLHLLPPW